MLKYDEWHFQFQVYHLNITMLTFTTCKQWNKQSPDQSLLSSIKHIFSAIKTWQHLCISLGEINSLCEVPQHWNLQEASKPEIFSVTAACICSHCLTWEIDKVNPAVEEVNGVLRLWVMDKELGYMGWSNQTWLQRKPLGLVVNNEEGKLHVRPLWETLKVSGVDWRWLLLETNLLKESIIRVP
jgi:hypothetical protein